MLGLPEARIPLADAVILVATSPKSNTGEAAIDKALADDAARQKAGRFRANCKTSITMGKMRW